MTLDEKTQKALNDAEELLILAEYKAGLKKITESQERLRQYVKDRIEQESESLTKGIKEAFLAGSVSRNNKKRNKNRITKN